MRGKNIKLVNFCRVILILKIRNIHPRILFKATVGLNTFNNILTSHICFAISLKCYNLSLGWLEVNCCPFL